MSTVWAELVTTGLLGTDRRDPPDLPAGPVAAVVADALDPTPAARLLTAVAATIVAQRAGLTPGPPRPPLQPPDDDRRPLLPSAAARRWHGLVAYWPVLETEWMQVAAEAGWRPPPDVLVAMLRRAHRSPGRRHAAMKFGGALAAWLVDHVPDLVPASRSTEGAIAELAVPVELRAGFSLPPDEFAAVVVTGLFEGVFRWAHRNVLLNALAAMPAAFLPAMIEALTAGRASPRAEPVGLWESLIELATVRRSMLLELELR